MTWEGIPSYHEQAMELEELNNKANNGRGVGSVKSIITYLKMCDGNSARLVAQTDFDKIRNYPEIVEWLKSNKII